MLSPGSWRSLGPGFRRETSGCRRFGLIAKPVCARLHQDCEGQQDSAKNTYERKRLQPQRHDHQAQALDADRLPKRFLEQAAHTLTQAVPDLVSENNQQAHRDGELHGARQLSAGSNLPLFASLLLASRSRLFSLLCLLFRHVCLTFDDQGDDPLGFDSQVVEQTRRD